MYICVVDYFIFLNWILHAILFYFILLYFIEQLDKAEGEEKEDEEKKKEEEEKEEEKEEEDEEEGEDELYTLFKENEENIKKLQKELSPHMIDEGGTCMYEEN